MIWSQFHLSRNNSGKRSYDMILYRCDKEVNDSYFMLKNRNLKITYTHWGCCLTEMSFAQTL